MTLKNKKDLLMSGIRGSLWKKCSYVVTSGC